ncbi:MAG: glutathione S-transferase family protein [Holophagales bacterium]|nr:glutathione S-transferase family protein [Holophagales bacterium]MXW02340.1 glutathione S-transferase family protein [Holophagales bacterium]MYC09738.1 glutathione S-transferase family protein [Holophagales bacterium]
MKLYWSPGTRAVRAVWMLEEANLDYKRVRVDLSVPERCSELLAASPMGKVPALWDGHVRMWESAAICMYLADRYAPGRLAPASSDPDRGPYLQWMFFSPGAIEPATAEKEAGRLSVPRVNGWGNFERMIDSWERGLSGKRWILGDRFTAADVVLGSNALTMRSEGALPISPVLEAYADRCLGRKARKRALAMAGE